MTRHTLPYCHHALEHPIRGRSTGPCAFALLFAGALFLIGCQQPLFMPTDQRSQYDRYDRVRDHYAEPFTEDEFGRREPNLRGRLTKRK